MVSLCIADGSKSEGITKEIMQVALNQAKGARLDILGVMEQAITRCGDISEFAPRIHTIKINPDKIKMLSVKAALLSVP